MLPAHLAENIRKQVLFYLQSTFDFRDKAVDQAFERFLVDPENGLFKGPWVQMQRPFRPADQDETVPFEFPVPFHPFKHQNRSWRRLTSKEQTPRPTIVTTGTGSGKTECFLFPILDHCLRAHAEGQKGIKAIILYPMNALAADQEKRFARVVWETPELKQAGIRVGNYTGRYDPADPGASADSGTRAMGEDHGISNHEVQQDDPPDILLTNYKMLDYLLLRPQDQRLWRLNEPGVLKYLVLDELHTYDGAQGADVACLLRRLKERLEIPRGELCVVGTSATLDDREAPGDRSAPEGDTDADAQETGSDRLARFATTLFEEDIDAEAVIGEDRLTVEEIVKAELEDVELPNPTGCQPLDDEDALKYAIRQARLWDGPRYSGPDFAEQVFSKRADSLTDEERDAVQAVEQWSLELGEWLKGRRLFKYLLDVFARAEVDSDGPVTWRDLVERLAREDLSFSDIPQYDNRSYICASFFALVAQARELRSGTAFPLVPTQVQLWIRELRRLGRVLFDKPVFSWLDEPTREYPSLPTFHCSECGEAGWIGLHDPSLDTQLGAKGVHGMVLHEDPGDIYRGWFGYKGFRSPHIVVFSPINEDENVGNLIPINRTDEDSDEAATTEQAGPAGEQQDFGFTEWYLCPKSLVLRQEDGPCPLTGDTKRFRVRINHETRADEQHGAVGDQGCPNCQSSEGVLFIGAQSATLSSVAIDELFGSVLNNDPKLLAFTDSVQDASHRAGFFSARTFQFTFRTALQHVIDDAGPDGLPLPQTGKALLDWWTESRPGWPGHVREAMASLMPPDLRDYPDFIEYRDNPGADKPSRSLRNAIEKRLTWEVTSGFGLMQTHGRTLEPAGSSCLGWDEEKITTTVAALREKIPGIDGDLERITDEQLRLWIYGFLYRARVRGAMNHPYLPGYATRNFWGKNPFGRTIPDRETHPSFGRYRPHLMVTQHQRGHDHVLAPPRGNQPPWQLVWARRALGLPPVEDASLLDLIDALLITGTEAGLLQQLHQDGDKRFYAISAAAAFLHGDRIHLMCSHSGKSLVRPPDEAYHWESAPSMEYYASEGRYQPADYTPRQEYYQDRYKKGALRRVVANEHTGLLATEEREQLERTFSRERHTDDTNVLTCTSTLEMGIDIGDLSCTMLCSIPPNTASYLQRIGRAGRATGTALVISVVNQRPHDLFFYGRPGEMLRGKVDPPGCWLDASAVLVRQYLAYCFDSATKNGELTELPRSGRQLVEDMEKTDGHIPQMMRWVVSNETSLRGSFLQRLQANILDDTRERFIGETAGELLLQRAHGATGEFERTLRDLQNARKRLKDQLAQLEDEEKESRQEIERELHILQGRVASLNRTSALEILTDHGLLPNYAFPERGVRFFGAVYNKHRGAEQNERPIEVIRAAGVALKELAPANHFYTHSRCFDIQQIAIGNKQEPLIDDWAICGACGHMRKVEDLTRPEALPACPQCGHDQQADAQVDQGQHRQFIEFSRSQALSHMEHYESLSSDRSEERERQYYQTVRSFDLTREAPSGAVGDEALPFGIEYLASVVLREINVGFSGQQGVILFGVDEEVPEEGFRVCRDCGIVIPPGTPSEKVVHRRSCRGRKRDDTLRQQGKHGQPYHWESIYLFRELQSEAIRLLLPVADDDDIDTLTACIHLGLRLQFEGNPAHLVVAPLVLPDMATNMHRYYLVLLDAVPGGTGYLKTLYQEKDDQDRDGEGIMQVMRLAKNALETCTCRHLRHSIDEQDPDGCYRCLRTYHQQYKSETISRERGIVLLGQLIEAGEKRVPQKELASIKPNSLFGSMLEKKFVDRLQEHVLQRGGKWEQTIIRGNQGFRFVLLDSDRLWELELQPRLGPAQGVSIPNQPDFLLHNDDDQIRPIAIFTDGFQFHCHPNNRLADDMQKRRAILESGNYHVWSVTWDDLDPTKADHVMVCDSHVVQRVQQLAGVAKNQGLAVPDAPRIFRNGMEQLKAFLDSPIAAGWTQLASFSIFFPLQMLTELRNVGATALQAAIEDWREGGGIQELDHSDQGEWIYNDKASLNQDVVTYVSVADAVSNRQDQVVVLARLGDDESEVTGSDFHERWRRFLACLNLMQFCRGQRFWTTSEVKNDLAPEIPFEAHTEVVDEWQSVLDETLPSLRPYVEALATSSLPLPDALPQIEYFSESIDDDAFCELAWPGSNPPIALLVGEQSSFATQWQEQGWNVITPDEIQARGISYLIDTIATGISGA